MRLRGQGRYFTSELQTSFHIHGTTSTEMEGGYSGSRVCEIRGAHQVGARLYNIKAMAMARF